MTPTKTRIWARALSLVASLLMIAVLFVDQQANACEKEAARDVSHKAFVALSSMSAFMSLWAAQFVAKEPKPPSPLGETAGFAVEMAQEAQNDFIKALTSQRCSSWATASQWLIVAAFMLTTATAWELRERP